MSTNINANETAQMFTVIQVRLHTLQIIETLKKRFFREPPKKVLHLDTAKEPSPRNLFRFRTKPRGLVFFVLRNLLKFCTKLERFRGEGSFAASR